MKLSDAAAKLTALAEQYPDAEIDVWLGGDYGQCPVVDIESPVASLDIDNTDAVVVVRFA
ncbi:hypothetical protein PBI_ORION_84 [Mycobacterium phage Orion]|uniref:Uncharacterized protein n=42 Tax=Pegunavirus TaxID=1623295 RepID=Q716J1_9CAUD|nr:hypothetical protein PBI_PG1_84 [Mycobacterium phage PG1]YP_009168262.1 hypothetical protein UNCLEHOWIE_82 [Mycobacterium phage UncleHowie]YP_009198758.1 hypothetical protein VORTEX_84 [Mycobacterium phage Vortex]YP_009211882.1 hypothetical protein AVV57_gp84 [Mycobacterium phage Phipps]YP_010096590.1 hypothetical protein KNT94_gp77 [Mycobacterium phage KingTut]YP_655180.1 gp84 [Mycobacterium phage Orion]ACI12808.1 hypothetical protein CHAH_88 [Mycobacterium phage Chah]ACU41919.1 hypothet